MRTFINFAIFCYIASTVSGQGAAGYGSYVDPGIKAGKEPHLQLFSSKHYLFKSLL
jgi:hypothetical protein